MLSFLSVWFCVGTVVTLSRVETSFASPGKNRLIKPHYNDLEETSTFLSTDNPVVAADATAECLVPLNEFRTTGLGDQAFKTELKPSNKSVTNNAIALAGDECSKVSVAASSGENNLVAMFSGTTFKCADVIQSATDIGIQALKKSGYDGTQAGITIKDSNALAVTYLVQSTISQASCARTVTCPDQNLLVCNFSPSVELDGTKEAIPKVLWQTLLKRYEETVESTAAISTPTLFMATLLVSTHFLLSAA